MSFRERLILKYRKHRAALIALNLLGPDERVGVDATLNFLQSASTSELRRQADRINSHYKTVMREFGVRATLEELEHLIEDDREGKDRSPDKLKLVQKFVLREYFAQCERAFPGFAKLPLHAAFGIDIYSNWSPGMVQWYLLEASLYEDLAFLWNIAATETARIEQLGPTSKELKHSAALVRAAAKAAFNLLEGYLNGLAFDILLSVQTSSEEQKKLTEWDESRGRAVHLTLRDKVLQYPKIALAVAHPPIQESSSPALCAVLEAEQHVRHALIHPGPSFVQPKEFREKAFYDLSLAEVARLCDSIISLVLEVSAVVGPAYGDVARWLIPRNENGLFPAEAFQ